MQLSLVIALTDLFWKTTFPASISVH
uniref:Uncharacterized protein n=1 Tax=Rhizophora mucronata TaxID=61149 RepID=A0A2P2QCK0_RHIMU